MHFRWVVKAVSRSLESTMMFSLNSMHSNILYNLGIIFLTSTPSPAASNFLAADGRTNRWDFQLDEVIVWKVQPRISSSRVSLASLQTAPEAVERSTSKNKTAADTWIRFSLGREKSVRVRRVRSYIRRADRLQKVITVAVGVSCSYRLEKNEQNKKAVIPRPQTVLWMKAECRDQLKIEAHLCHDVGLMSLLKLRCLEIYHLRERLLDFVDICTDNLFVTTYWKTVNYYGRTAVVICVASFN